MISQTFLDRLGLPGVSVSILLTVTAGYWLKGAVVHSGRTVKYTVPAKVGAVLMNNSQVGLIEETSAANVVSNPGTWFYDSATGLLYVNPPNPTARSIHSDTYQARLTFYFSKLPKTFRDAYWRPLLLGAPDLSMRIDPRFTGVGQIGSGNIALANADGFFDRLDDNVQWRAGTVRLELGLDLPTGAMDEADYQLFGTWSIERTERDADRFTLFVREPKTNLENLIPRREFTRALYPAIAEEIVGKPIPYAWGRVFGVKPTLINRLAKKFKLADHPIKSLEAVRMKRDGEGWKQINYASVDLIKAEFTLGDDWDEDQELSVDFFGRTNADGTRMENPADVMADLLNYAGEVNLDYASFSASRAYYRIGTDKYREEVTLLAPCIYLDSPRPALEVVSEINSIAGSFLFSDFAGLWRYGAAIPCRASALDPMAGVGIKSFSELDLVEGSMRKQVDNKDIFSKLVVRYNERTQEEWAESVSEERPPLGHIHNLSPLFTKTLTVGLGKTSDAKYWAQRYLTTEAEPLTRYFFDVPWKGFLLLPGDKVKAVYGRFALNSVLEVLEVRYDLNTLTARLVTGNLRGWNDTHGFWVEDGTLSELPQEGLRIWLKSENLLGVEGERLLTWRDASAFGNNGTATGLSGPNFNQSANNANGSPVAYLGFDEVGGSLVSQTFDFPEGCLSSFTSGEIFAVLKPDTLNTDGFNNNIWDLGTTVPTVFPDGLGNIRESFGCNIVNVVAASPIDGWNLYNVSRTTGNMAMRLNTVEIYNANPAGAMAFPTDPRLSTTAASGKHFAGSFAEVLLYNRILSTAERDAVVQYLSDKYALALVAAGTSPVWDSGWSDTEASNARQDRGYWHGQDGSGNETDMADATDARSFQASRWS